MATIHSIVPRVTSATITVSATSHLISWRVIDGAANVVWGPRGLGSSGNPRTALVSGLEADTPYTLQGVRGASSVQTAQAFRTQTYPSLSTAPDTPVLTPLEDRTPNYLRVRMGTEPYTGRGQLRYRPAGGDDWTEDLAPAGNATNGYAIYGDPGQAYEVQGRWANPVSQSAWSASATGSMPKRLDNTLAAPVVAGQAGADRIDWSWPAVAGAGTYRWRGGAWDYDGGEYYSVQAAVHVPDLTAPNYAQTGLLSGSRYFGGARAETSARRGPWSATVQVVTLGQSQPSQLVLSAYTDSVEATWHAPQAADDYQYDVRWKDSVTSSWGAAHRTSERLYRITGLTGGHVYDVGVRAVPTTGSPSAWTEAQGSLALSAPSLQRLQAGRTDAFVQLTAPAGGANYYESQLRVAAADAWSPVTRRAGITFTVSGLRAETSYTLRVRARQANGGMSAWLDIAFATVIGGGLLADVVAPAGRAAAWLSVRSPAGRVLGPGPVPVTRLDMRLQLDTPLTWSADLAMAEDTGFDWPNLAWMHEPGSTHFLGIGSLDVIRDKPAPGIRTRTASGTGQLAALADVDIPADWMGDDAYSHATALDRLGQRAPGWTLVPAASAPIDEVIWAPQRRNLQEALRLLAQATGTRFYGAAAHTVRFIDDFVRSPYWISAYGEQEDGCLALWDFEVATDHYERATRVLALDNDGAGLASATADIPTPEGYSLDADRRILINAALEAQTGIQKMRRYVSASTGGTDATAKANALLAQARAFLRKRVGPQITYRCTCRVRSDQYLPPLVGRRIELRLRQADGSGANEVADVHECEYRVDAGERLINLVLSPLGGSVRPPPDQQMADWLPA